MSIREASIQKLLKQTSKSFGESVLRAMLVSSEGDDGKPRKITQQELAELSGVGRSTIAKYSTMTDDEKIVVNPDLETICRLADSLNVSPAFLLMRPEDWSHLAQAAMYLSAAVQDEKFTKMSSEIAESSISNAISTSLLGLKLASKFKLYEDQLTNEDIKNKYSDQISIRKKRIRHGILATSSLPPMGKLKKNQITPLLTLCAIIGAHLNSFE